MKEAEAALFVAKHLVRGENDGQGQRHLILVDSMALSYMLGKGRAGDPRLLAAARKWACISVAGDLLLVYRWIPSEFNVADKDSGRWEGEHDADEVQDTFRSSELNSRLAELDAPLSPLVENALPWMELCAEQNAEAGRRVRRGRKPHRAPIRGLVRWEQVGEGRGASGSDGTCAKRTNLSPNPTPLQNHPVEPGGRTSTWSQLSRKLRSGTRNDGQLPEGRRGLRSVRIGDRTAAGLEERSGGRNDMLGIPRSLVHSGLRVGRGESVDSCYPHDVPAVQPPWRSRHAAHRESFEGMVQTDAANEPMAITVDNGGGRFGDSVAATEACGRSCDPSELPGVPASW